MKATISDTHDSHGSVFTLLLEQGKNDGKVMAFLRKQFTGENPDYFYVYKATAIGKRILAISFSEASLKMAKVDFVWNLERDDQKFPVLVLEDKIDETVNGDFTSLSENLPLCHWCKNKVWGVNRSAIEVYLPEKSGDKFVKTLVQVHDTCQEIREKQIAEIPFPENIS